MQRRACAWTQAKASCEAVTPLDAAMSFSWATSCTLCPKFLSENLGIFLQDR